MLSFIGAANTAFDANRFDGVSYQTSQDCEDGSHPEPKLQWSNPPPGVPVQVHGSQW